MKKGLINDIKHRIYGIPKFPRFLFLISSIGAVIYPVLIILVSLGYLREMLGGYSKYLMILIYLISFIISILVSLGTYRKLQIGYYSSILFIALNLILPLIELFTNRSKDSLINFGIAIIFVAVFSYFIYRNKGYYFNRLKTTNFA